LNKFYVFIERIKLEAAYARAQEDTKGYEETYHSVSVEVMNGNWGSEMDRPLDLFL
jgi:hypothetical protein